MIKGLIALFVSGIIFNPVVLLGIIIGAFCAVRFDLEQIFVIFRSFSFLGLAILVSLIYNFTLNKRFQDDEITPDYKEILKNTLKSAALFYIASACGALLINFIVI